jgi:hypothetical protein
MTVKRMSMSSPMELEIKHVQQFLDNTESNNMRKRKMHILGILLIATVLTGCAPVTSSVTASCFTQPVFLGKIKKIHAVEETQWNLKVPFSIERRSSNGALIWEPMSVFEENVYYELFKLVESPHDKIVVHEVFIRSHSGWAFLMGSLSGGTGIRTVINGSILREDAAGNDADR